MFDNFYDYQGNNVNEFVRNYREALGAQRDSAYKALNQQRRNAQTSIMSNANVAGALYSNFPERSKIQYDTQKFYPAMVNVQSSYQSSLDKLRSNVLNLYNQIKAYDEAIADLS